MSIFPGASVCRTWVAKAKIATTSRYTTIKYFDYMGW